MSEPTRAELLVAAALDAMGEAALMQHLAWFGRAKPRNERAPFIARARVAHAEAVAAGQIDLFGVEHNGMPEARHG